MLAFYFIFILKAFLAALGLGCSAWPLSSCRERGLLSGCGAWASVAEHGLWAHGLQELQQEGFVAWAQ